MGQGPMPGSAFFGGIFFFLWFVMMMAMVAGYVILLVALWRGMKAHESIARTLEQIADSMPLRSKLEIPE